MDDMESIIWIAAVIVVWVALGFGIARENERVVKIRLGRPYGMAGSGLFWIPFGIAWVRRYTTKVVELTFAQRDEKWNVIKKDGKPVPAGGFITAIGKFGKRDVGPVNIGVTLSFRFNWPQDWIHLRKCVELLPNPEEIRELTDLFQEIVMDAARSVGCEMTYIDIMSRRHEFAEKITAAAKQSDTGSSLIVDTGLQDSARVVIDHIDVPKETLEAIDDEEAERLKAEGVRRKAEGEKDKLKLEGEGRAAAITALKDVPDAKEYEALRTLREMAAGTSNTVFFPLEGVRKLFENFFGR